MHKQDGDRRNTEESEAIEKSEPKSRFSQDSQSLNDLLQKMRHRNEVLQVKFLSK